MYILVRKFQTGFVVNLWLEFALIYGKNLFFFNFKFAACRPVFDGNMSKHILRLFSDAYLHYKQRSLNAH